jgi:DNA repair protein RecO (recombination protein O)
LLPLPRFLVPGSNVAPTPRDVLDGLALTGFFLDRRVFAPHGRKLPAARSRFVDVLQRIATLSRGEAS